MEPINISQLTAKYTDQEKAMVISAYEYAINALKYKTRENGTPFMEHPIGVASIVSNEIGLMADAVTAVFLHEGSRGQEGEEEKMVGQYSHEVINMVHGLNKISCIDIKETKLNEEIYRKLIVSYSTDPRVTLIKLADRLEIMRHLDIFSKEKIAQKNTETVKLYIPLAHKLGMYNLKSEMEDLYFKYSDPENYRLVANKLKATESDREKLVKQFIEPLDIALKKKYTYRLKVRTKTAYSIWKKMIKQNIAFEEVYDVFAIRFIIDAPIDKEHEYCWDVYSYVTKEYTPDTTRLRDWLTKPKPNGYESLHITVRNREGIAIEVQIRTERMDKIAESGYASHWRYKGIKSIEGFDDWLGNVRKLLNDNKHDAYSTIENSSLNEIVVFTPTGEMKQLPKGATILDFAFNVHSKLGLKCSGGKINGKLVPIRATLNTGDTVEILRNNNQKVSADWLGFVVSSRARSRIRAALKEEEGRKSLIGREMLERRLRNWKIDYTDDISTELAKHFKFKAIGDFYISLNDGKTDFVQIKKYLDEKESQGKCREERDKENHAEQMYKLGHAVSSADGDFLIINDNLNNVDFKMAKCCNPIFGDDVFGFVSATKGIKIHRINCPNAARLFENYPYRIQKVKWRQISNTTQFQTKLKIIVEGEESTGTHIIECATGQNASIRSFSIEKRNKEGELNFMLGISISNKGHLDKVISEIKKVKGVRTIIRTAGE
jgi:GTP diphosphokinase / guanosine-3',5'-bis(diphosphate) 3'-diphosphatase